MGILKNIFKKKVHQPTPTDELNKILDRFTTATIMGIDREDLGRYPAKQYKVMAFHFGAIEYLAKEFGLDESRTLGVFVGFIDKYFNMPISETGSISERLQGFQENETERAYLVAGIDVFRRWHEQNERRAPLELGEMLNSE